LARHITPQPACAGDDELPAAQGAPLLTPHAGSVAPAALPKTDHVDTPAVSGWLLLVAVLGLIAGR